MIEIRFLQDLDLIELHEPFLRAFSDYFVPMHATREQFQELLIRRGARSDLSVAAFDGARIVGFNMNAFDIYQNTPTVYDVATGIVPEARRQGLASRLFEFSLPRLQSTGGKRYTLEVFQNNSRAFHLYEKVGFKTIRGFEAYVCARAESKASESAFRMEEVEEPDWTLFRSFWDWEPSWQNSIASIRRARAAKIIAVALQQEETVGYGIVFPDSGDIPQLAVHPQHRKKGAGTALLHRLQSHVHPGKPVRLVNLDSSDGETIRFLTKRDFTLLGKQFEMELPFTLPPDPL